MLQSYLSTNKVQPLKALGSIFIFSLFLGYLTLLSNVQLAKALLQMYFISLFIFTLLSDFEFSKAPLATPTVPSFILILLKGLVPEYPINQLFKVFIYKVTLKYFVIKGAENLRPNYILLLFKTTKNDWYKQNYRSYDTYYFA